MKTKTQQNLPLKSSSGDQSKPSETDAVGGSNNRSDEARVISDSSTETDILQLRQENEQLKTSIRNAAAHRQITGELERIGARSPELLFEAVKGELQFSADGAIANSAAIVERLRRNFPEQFGRVEPLASIDAGAGFRGVSSLSKESLARMKPADIAKLDWEDVKRTLAQG